MYTIIDKVVLAVAFNSKALKLSILHDDEISFEKLIFDIKDVVMTNLYGTPIASCLKKIIAASKQGNMYRYL